MLPAHVRARAAAGRPRLLPPLRRRTALWWAATAVLAGATALVVGGALAGAEEAATRLGPLRSALVATRDLPAGAVVDAEAAEVRQLPAVLVASGAAGPEDLGRRAGAPLVAGEVVQRARLAPAGLSALAAALPPGTRGIAVPTGAGALPLTRGDVVDVLVITGDHGAVPPTATVAAGAVVVDAGEGAVTVAVAGDDAERVAYAVATGLVTLALTGR